MLSSFFLAGPFPLETGQFFCPLDIGDCAARSWAKMKRLTWILILFVAALLALGGYLNALVLNTTR